jgi:tetratricopeptide (TPR) repeat protein
MRRIEISILILLFTFASISYGQSINELPLYGGFEKSESQKKEDQNFVINAIQQMGSRDKAAEHIIIRGWQSLSMNDIKTSIKRFNQAWLIDPSNGQIYWGLGVAQAMQGKYESAIKLYGCGDSIIKDNPRFLADYGHAVIRYSVELKSIKSEYLPMSEKGIKLIKRAIELNPDLADAYFYLAVAEHNKENYKLAWENVHIAQKKGYSGIGKDFIKMLELEMPDPKQ